MENEFCMYPLGVGCPSIQDVDAQWHRDCIASCDPHPQVWERGCSLACEDSNSNTLKETIIYRISNAMQDGDACYDPGTPGIGNGTYDSEIRQAVRTKSEDAKCNC